MPWTLNISLLDIASYYSSGLPVMTGSLWSPPSSGGMPPLDAIISTPPALLTLNFPSAASPPSGATTVRVTDSGTGGDLLRSGTLSSVPRSPATATVITLPPATIPAATVAAAATASAPGPMAVPYWVRFISTILTAGTWIPLVVSVRPLTATLGSGTVTVTVPINLAARVFFFFVATSTLTLTLTLTPRPSGDPATLSRILSMTRSAMALVGQFAEFPFSAWLAGMIEIMIESGVNALILSTARGLMASMGLAPSPTSAFCARRVTVTPGGINLQLVLSDLLGPAVVTLPGTFAVAIAPTPVAATLQVYTVTVTNAATGAALPGATVTLQNYDASGASQRTVANTDATGQARFNVSLRGRPTIIITTTGEDGRPVREQEEGLIRPSLLVEMAGFNSMRIRLL